MKASEHVEDRRTVFDVLKGIGILEVIAHHSLGHAGRKFTEEGSIEWWSLRLVNRTLHFAIPLFLLVSAALLTQSLLKRPDWRRFAQRRVSRTLWPYLLWTGVYLLFRWRVLQVGSDTWIAEYTYPLIGTLRGPQMFVDLNELWRELVWGKAYFYLYFMVVLLQLAIVLPLVIAFSRRLAWGFGRTAAAAAGLQIAMFFLQREVLHVLTPASMVLWYVPSVLLGVWIGIDMDRWKARWSGVRLPLAAALAVGFPAYMACAITLERGGSMNSIVFNSAYSIYTIAASLLLFGLAPSIAAVKAGGFLALFGRVSLPMFLVHPMILHWLSGPRITAALNLLPVPAVGTIILATVASYAFARLTMGMRLDPFLFGQKLVRKQGLTATV